MWEDQLEALAVIRQEMMIARSRADAMPFSVMEKTRGAKMFREKIKRAVLIYGQLIYHVMKFNSANAYRTVSILSQCHNAEEDELLVPKVLKSLGEERQARQNM